MKLYLDRIGVIGLWITAVMSPCCFPLFASLFALLGFGEFELFGAWTMNIFQVLVLLSLVGFIFSYKKHRCFYPLVIALPASILIFYSYYFIEADYWTNFMYAGMGGLFIASAYNFFKMKAHSKVILKSIISCPHCGYKKEELMPENACQYFYECEQCYKRLKPNEGDCCVFCSYGTVKCPPIQKGDQCC